MTLSWLRGLWTSHKRTGPVHHFRPTLEALNDRMTVPSRTSHKRPIPFRPALEVLDERIVPSNAHFINATDVLNSAGALVASWKEAGLGDTVQVNYSLSANASATYVYVNKGGNLPQAPQFTFVSGPVTATGTFTSGKNGNITASLTLQPPPAPQAFIDATPNGLHVALFEVSYSNVVLTDTTNNVSISLADLASGPLIQSKHG